jgi:hypothetical protein
MLLAPLGKCPLCGFGQVTTLDHFLSQSRYPTYSTLSYNLIPCCADCNKGKGSSIITEAEQISHLYFEDQAFDNDQWLFATIASTNPITITFTAIPPEHWNLSLSTRVQNFFKDLDLARRFGVEASAEVAGLKEMLHELETQERRSEHLQRTARVEYRIKANSWRTALYQSLAQNTWYQTEGYLMTTRQSD